MAAALDKKMDGHLIEHLLEIEAAAEDILADKQQIIDLDRKRQKTREAVRTLSKDKTSKKQWVCVGNMFLQLPSSKTKVSLDKDFNELDTEIGLLRKNLKNKVNHLFDLEMKDELKGFHLNPLSKEELKSLDGFCG